MSALTVTLVLVGLFLLVVGLFALRVYNRGVTLRNRCHESWSNVETELKRRYNLIPNLVSTVKGYAKHERELFESITRARTAAIATNGKPADAQADAERPVVAGLARLLAVAEAYPDLKASGNFLQLQKELANTEDRIQASRRFYNANVRDQRNLLLQFPNSIFANLFSFRPEPFFKVDRAMTVAPKVAV